MIDRFFDLFYFIQKEIYGLKDLNFNEIFYSDIRTSFIVGAIIIGLVIFKMVGRWLWRDKNSQKYSGSQIGGYYWQGLFFKFFSLIPRLIFTLAILGTLLALSEPFLNQITEDKKIVESRIRIDLKDGSTSMEQLFSDTKKSKAQVAAEAHLDFLKLRFGKNDRVSSWIFAGFPHMMEDFIVDDELYFQQVEDSPWIIFGGDLEEFFQNNPNFQVPKDRYGLVSGDGGGTDITLALKAITEQFDQDERKLKISGTDVSKMRRSLLIITDAEVYSFPADELGGLSKRNIKPYVILVRASNEVSTPEFANRIKDYGGEYFDVSDATSLKRAYEAIDRLEAVEIEITRRIFTFPIFQKFILASVLIIFCAIFIGLILAPFEAYP